MALPGVVPRLQQFAQDGFGWLALLMALTYRNARLLPATHPYCHSANKGRFGIRHVIAEAANHLVFRRENIDQIIIFFAMLVGIVLLLAQFALLIGMLIFKAAFAGPPAPFAGMFNTPDATHDIALTLLAQVFGVPGLFCTVNGPCTEYETTVTLPTPFHYGLQGLMEFYSLAILLVGVLVLLYYIVLMVGETAQTGTPFGRRFSHIYAPMRLVVAIGLLVPINYGLNSAQYITLFAARMGSGFATNAWSLFNRELTNATGLENATLIARTTAPDAQYVMNFMMLVQACRAGYELNSQKEGNTQITILPYFVKTGTYQDATSQSFQNGLDFYDQGDVIIRFGMQDSQKYEKYTGGVFPFCGEITVHRVDSTQPGVLMVAEQYFETILTLWSTNEPRDFGQRAAYLFTSAEPAQCFTGSIPGPCYALPPASWKQDMETFYQTSFTAMTDAAWQEMNDSGVFTVEPELLARGWGGAGIWYNRIAQWNGAFISAVKNMPSPSALPYPMIQVQTARRGEAGNITTEDRFNPQINGDAINFEKQYERDIAVELHRVYTYWNLDPATEAADVRDNSNMFINFINMVFGLDGLFVIRENHDIHPLAQLVALGKGIVDAAVRNLVIAIGSSAIAGGMEGFSGNSVAGAAGNSLSGIFVTLATVGLTVGFILYYVLPFLPFMYFFFAVGGWVKSIFEAMVGVPLWALAHLKVDGNGLPGDLAMNGYFLVFEIFVRPILTVFGLLASLSIFTAMVRVLHEIFPLITQNMTGFSAGESTAIPTLLYTALAQNMGMEFKRDPVDEFFFTILYTIIVYLLATSSFKLIDQIPNNILRWMGAGVQSFNDRRDDPTQGLVQFAALGGSQMSGQVAGVMTQGAHGAGMVGGSVARGISDLLPSFGLTNRVTGK